MNRPRMPPPIMVAALAATLWSGTADAHAFLVSAVPAVGSTVALAPRHVRLTFTEAVEPTFCTVDVTDANGGRMDAGDVQADGPAALTVPLQPLRPGRYNVTWRATSVDTHKTSGRFSFTVAP